MRELKRESISESAKLFNNRYSMMEYFGAMFPNPGAVMEIGVGLGGFSEHLIDFFSPGLFIGVDTFTLHKLPSVFGKKSQEWFGEKTHLEYYTEKLSKHISGKSGISVSILDVNSANLLSLGISSGSVNVIYIDADHGYRAVKKDLETAKELIHTNGLIVLNDYTKYDPIHKTEYGVADALNEFMNENPDYEIVGFAFEQNMFCDIAISKKK